MKAMNLTDEEKQELLGEHFYYEVKMLSFTATKLIEFTQIDIWNKNMALETFLLHARNLREFFYRDSKQHETDARAYEFVKERNKWEEARPEETEWIKKVRERVNTELAHLTYRRYAGTPPDKGWKHYEIQKDFLKVVKIFLDHLPKKYIDKRLQEIEQMCPHVDTTTNRQGDLSTPASTTSTVSTASSLEANNNYSRYRHKGRP